MTRPITTLAIKGVEVIRVSASSHTHSTLGALELSGIFKLDEIKSGATQVAASAVINEVWKTLDHATLPDNVLMIGV